MGIVAKILLLPWLAVAAYLVCVGVNWDDRAPSATALRFETYVRTRPPVADDENAFVYFLGFSVDRTADPRATGVERMRWARRLAQGPTGPALLTFPGARYALKSTRGPTVQAVSEACNKVVDRACLHLLETKEDDLREWLATEDWVLARYRGLLVYPAWRETFPLDDRIPLPLYGPLLEGQKVLLASAWMRAGRGDAVGVRTLLTEDIRFWRQVLAGSDFVISKAVAAEALRRHFLWSNLALRRLPPSRLRHAIPQVWAVPISKAERSILGCMTAEWMFQTDRLRRMKAGALNPFALPPEKETAARWLVWRLLRPMLQVQDTSNRFAQYFLTDVEAADVSYERLREAVKRARAITSDMVKDATRDEFRVSPIYNKAGILLFAIFTPVFRIIERFGDLEGLRRMALLTAELRSQGLTPDQVPHHLEKAAFRDPYTGKPFEWDKATGAIVFTGRYALLY